MGRKKRQGEKDDECMCETKEKVGEGKKPNRGGKGLDERQPRSRLPTTLAITMSQLQSSPGDGQLSSQTNPNALSAVATQITRVHHYFSLEPDGSGRLPS